MRPAVLAASLVAVVGAARADAPVDRSRGFWVSSVDGVGRADVAVTMVSATCPACENTEPISLVFADVEAQQPLARDLAAFAVVSVLHRGAIGGFEGESDGHVGPVTLGLRQRFALGDGVSAVVSPSVTLPRDLGNGKTAVTAAFGQLVRPDESLSVVLVSTARVAAGLRARRDRLWGQAELVVGLHGVGDARPAGSARGAAAIGVTLAPALDLVAEAATRLWRDDDACKGCLDDGDLARPFFGVGARAAWGPVAGALQVGLGPDAVGRFEDPSPLVTVGAGARW